MISFRQAFHLTSLATLGARPTKMALPTALLTFAPSHQRIGKSHPRSWYGRQCGPYDWFPFWSA